MGASILYDIWKIWGKNWIFRKNPDASKQAKNTYLATNGARIRIQHIFLTHLDRVSALQLHGMTHSARIRHCPRVFALFSTGCLVIFLRYSHSLYKTHTADPPVSSFPTGMSHTIILEHPCPLPNPRRAPLHLWQTNSKSLFSLGTTRIRWGYSIGPQQNRNSHI